MHAATCSGKRRKYTHTQTVQTSRLLLLLYLLDGVLSSLHVHDAAAYVGEPTKRDGGHPEDDHALACIKYPADGPSAAGAHPSQPLRRASTATSGLASAVLAGRFSSGQRCEKEHRE